MTPERPFISPEQRAGVFGEVNLVVGRMYDDLNRPSAVTVAGTNERSINKFFDSFATTLQYNTTGVFSEDSGIHAQPDKLLGLQLPALTILHSRFARKQLPQTPEEFFQDLNLLKDHQLRQAAVSREELRKAQDFFERSTEVLDGTSALWLATLVTGVITKALRMKDKYDLRKAAVRMNPNAPLPDDMKELTYLSGLLTLAVERYVHPDTIKIWEELIDSEIEPLATAGIKIPSRTEKYLSVDQLNLEDLQA